MIHTAIVLQGLLLTVDSKLALDSANALMIQSNHKGVPGKLKRVPFFVQKSNSEATAQYETLTF